MAPSDFPLPICAGGPRRRRQTVRLKLPVMRSCYATTHVALQYARVEASGGHSWAIMRNKVLGGEIEVGGLQPRATHRFRLVGFEASSDSVMTPGASTPPFVTDMMHAPLLAPPTALPTSSASYTLTWPSDSPCRPAPRWRSVRRRREAGGDGGAAAVSAGGVGGRSLLERRPSRTHRHRLATTTALATAIAIAPPPRLIHSTGRAAGLSARGQLPGGWSGGRGPDTCAWGSSASRSGASKLRAGPSRPCDARSSGRPAGRGWRWSCRRRRRRGAGCSRRERRTRGGGGRGYEARCSRRREGAGDAAELLQHTRRRLLALTAAGGRKCTLSSTRGAPHGRPPTPTPSCRCPHASSAASEGRGCRRLAAPFGLGSSHPTAATGAARSWGGGAGEATAPPAAPPPPPPRGAGQRCHAAQTPAICRLPPDPPPPPPSPLLYPSPRPSAPSPSPPPPRPPSPPRRPNRRPPAPRPSCRPPRHPSAAAPRLCASRALYPEATHEGETGLDEWQATRVSGGISGCSSGQPHERGAPRCAPSCEDPSRGTAHSAAALCDFCARLELEHAGWHTVDATNVTSIGAASGHAPSSSYHNSVARRRAVQGAGATHRRGHAVVA